jgi:hypothetical protein
MGAWGTGIFDNDITCDVRDDLITYLEEGKTIKEATKLILDENLDDDEIELISLVYIGLAAIQLEKNCLQEDVRKMAIEMIESGSDLVLWEEGNKEEYDERKQVLNNLKEELLNSKSKATTATKKQRRKKLGDVYAIPLPNSKFAFGRIFKDAGIGIYKHIGESIVDIPMDENYQFIVGVYDYVLKSGNWSFVENRPFNNVEEAYPPPTCIIDSISGKYSIYHKGEIRASNKSECEGLEITAVWADNHIIDRIMGDDKWHKNDHF